VGVDEDLAPADECVSRVVGCTALGQSVACLGVVGVESVWGECEQYAHLQGGEDVEESLEALGERSCLLAGLATPTGFSCALWRNCLWGAGIL
jgi:hypothetical protein